jgi:enamine deaminase RidA (YjgF/YER057c/UK114 family)
MKTRNPKSRSITRRAALATAPALVASSSSASAAASAVVQPTAGEAGPIIVRANPPGLSTPRGYSHVVTAAAGRTVYVAGQVPSNAAGEVVGKGNFRAQTEQVFANLKIALEAAGASPRDVVKANVYVVNPKPDDVAVFREVRGAFFPNDHPASTFVGVTALANPDFLVEIEVIAVVR